MNRQPVLQGVNGEKISLNQGSYKMSGAENNSNLSQLYNVNG